MKTKALWYTVGAGLILGTQACGEMATTPPEPDAREAQVVALISSTRPSSADEAMSNLTRTFPGVFAEKSNAPSAGLLPIGEPQFSRGGFLLRKYFVDANRYVVVYSPHYGWAGPRGHAWHMNYSVWHTPVAWKTLDDGVPLNRLTEKANLHVSQQWSGVRPCLYVHDPVNNRTETTCLTGKTIAERAEQAARAVQKHIAAVLGITLALWFCLALVYLAMGAGVLVLA